MEADLKRLKATWEKDKDVARAAVGQARSQVEGLKIEIERLTVRAPIDGEALQVHVRLGQFAAMNWNEPMIILGDMHELHVRVDIDEQDLPYFAKSSRAVATLKGRPQVTIPAHLLRHRALRHPQAEPHRVEHRAGRYPGPPGPLHLAREDRHPAVCRPADGRLYRSRPAPFGDRRSTPTHARSASLSNQIMLF